MPRYGLTAGAATALVGQTLGALAILLVLRLRRPAPSRLPDLQPATPVNV
jgi:hypothetical protein